MDNKLQRFISGLIFSMVIDGLEIRNRMEEYKKVLQINCLFHFLNFSIYCRKESLNVKNSN